VVSAAVHESEDGAADAFRRRLFLAVTARSQADLEGQQRVCAVKGGAFQWVQVPPGETLQPEAAGAVMEVTK
jgi:hypothetical protein